MAAEIRLTKNLRKQMLAAAKLRANQPCLPQVGFRYFGRIQSLHTFVSSSRKGSISSSILSKSSISLPEMVIPIKITS